MFIKTRTKHASKAGLNLPSSNPSGVLDRSAVLRARGRGTGPRSLAHSTARQRALLRSHRDLRRKQTNTQSRKRNESFIVELKSEIIKMWSLE